MTISELFIMLLIYTSLQLFFLVPIQKEGKLKEVNTQSPFPSLFKESLRQVIYQKKALFALGLFLFVLFIAYSVFTGAEWHYNTHSGELPISYKLPTRFVMIGLTIYTFILTVTIGYLRCRKGLRHTFTK